MKKIIQFYFVFFTLIFNIKAELGTTYILELNYELPGLKNGAEHADWYLHPRE